jgi:hypothetical protein
MKKVFEMMDSNEIYTLRLEMITLSNNWYNNSQQLSKHEASKLVSAIIKILDQLTVFVLKKEQKEYAQEIFDKDGDV